MKKENNILILTAGILLFLLSYRFDQQVNLFFKNIKLPIFDAFFSIITNFWVVVIAFLIAPLIILYNKKNKRLAYLLLLTFVVSFAVAFAIKLVVLRQRPIESFAFPFTGIINYSFPSMHAMVVFSLLPQLAKFMPKQKYFWIAFAFLVAFSRLYFGFHFLSDVVFGALFGYLIGKYLLGLYEKRKLKL